MRCPFSKSEISGRGERERRRGGWGAGGFASKNMACCGKWKWESFECLWACFFFATCRGCVLCHCCFRACGWFNNFARAWFWQPDTT